MPPSPGTVGAFGIALLAREALARDAAPLEPRASSPRGWSARRSSSASRPRAAAGRQLLPHRPAPHGGGRTAPGLHLGRRVLALRQGDAGKKLPDNTPDPFRARAQAIEALVARLGETKTGAKRVAVAEAFQLKTLFPYFATFFRSLGLDIEVVRPGERDALRRGIEAANVPFCAPMQQYHGIVQAMADTCADFVFLPMLRDLPPVRDEQHTWLCPIVQGAPDVVRHDLGPALRGRVLSPIIRTGEGSSRPSGSSERSRARRGVEVADPERIASAHAAAREEQLRFDHHLLDLGRDAIERCRREGSSRSWCWAAPTPSTTTSSTRTSPRSCASRGARHPGRLLPGGGRGAARPRRLLVLHPADPARDARDPPRPGSTRSSPRTTRAGPTASPSTTTPASWRGSRSPSSRRTATPATRGQDARRGLPPLRARGPALRRERRHPGRAAARRERADAPGHRRARRPGARPAHGPRGRDRRRGDPRLRRRRRGAAARDGGHDPPGPAPHERQGSACR